MVNIFADVEMPRTVMRCEFLGLKAQGVWETFRLELPGRWGSLGELCCSFNLAAAPLRVSFWGVIESQIGRSFRSQMVVCERMWDVGFVGICRDLLALDLATDRKCRTSHHGLRCQCRGGRWGQCYFCVWCNGFYFLFLVDGVFWQVLALPNSGQPKDWII